MKLLRGGRPAAGRDQPRLRLAAPRSAIRCSRAPTSPASTSPARPPSSTAMWRTVGDEPRAATATTRASSARRAARTSSSRTRPPTSTRVATAIVRGSFEYQGQKCSAASRVFAPSNLWPRAARPARRARWRDAEGRQRLRLRELHGRRHRRQARSRRRRPRSTRRAPRRRTRRSLVGGELRRRRRLVRASRR